jgi:hypothetical protein
MTQLVSVLEPDLRYRAARSAGPATDAARAAAGSDARWAEWVERGAARDVIMRRRLRWTAAAVAVGLVIWTMLALTVW